MFWKLAWRNIWRNPRQTAIILVAMVIGVWSMIFMAALSRGMVDQMVANGIATLTGHLQIHHRQFLNDPAIEYRLDSPLPIIKSLENVLPEGSLWSPRMRVNAVVSSAHDSSAVTLVGILPQKEAQVSFIGRVRIDGRYLKENENRGILVGEALRKRLETRLGGKVVLMSQDIHGEIASRAFRVVGVFRTRQEEIEKSYAFTSLSASQQMLAAGNAVTEIGVILPEEGATLSKNLMQRLRESLPQNAVVDDWHALLPMLWAYMELMDGWMFIMFLIIFIAMAFGITNTLLMAVFERMREFGLLKAIGMKPYWILRGVLTESLLLLLMGMITGTFLGLFTAELLNSNGINLSMWAQGANHFGMPHIIYPKVFLFDVLAANGIVLLLGLAVSCYPACKAARFSPVAAMAAV